MIGHSKVYKSANPSFTHLTYWGCYLWPGCSPVIPTAAEVCLSNAPVPFKYMRLVFVSIPLLWPQVSFLPSVLWMVHFLGLLSITDAAMIGLTWHAWAKL